MTVSKFPALTIKNGTVDLVFSEEQLTSSIPRALKNGSFNGLLIIDSEGKGYIVERAEFVRNKGKRLFKSLFAPKLIEVRLIFREGSPFPVSLEDLKRYLTKAFDSDPGFWESAGLDPRQIKQRIQQASSVDEVMALVTPILTAGPTR